MTHTIRRVHYLQHEPFEGIGCIEQWISNHRYTVTSTRFFENDTLPDTDTFEVLIVMGGAMNIYEEAKFPWLAAEKQFIKKAVEEGKIVVGICLGAQLIADVLGGKVTQNPVKEIGWYPINLTDAGKENPMFEGLPETFTVFHWHGDTFEIPDGAIHLASSGPCPNQAYLYKDKVLGLQFHIEVTHETLAAMTTEMDDELTQGGPFVQDIYQMRKGAAHIGKCNEYVFKMLDRLVAN